jgi:hypothetical protein
VDFIPLSELPEGVPVASTDVSPDLISRVTDAVLDEVREWQNRPLDSVYPVVFFDALRVKIRDERMVKNKAVYVALALNPDPGSRAPSCRARRGSGFSHRTHRSGSGLWRSAAEVMSVSSPIAT